MRDAVSGGVHLSVCRSHREVACLFFVLDIFAILMARARDPFLRQ